jgi:hypothetical protein
VSIVSGRKSVLVVLCLFLFSGIAVGPALIQSSGPGLIVGQNVNIVAGTTLPDGDPWLQRQNEPTIAVSTRNALHLFVGANDYRTVDMPMSEGELPGIPEQASAGDAWMGVYKSYNGGESWISTLLPGFPQDMSPEGLSSPLKGFHAAADPTARSGKGGLLFLSGLAFERLDNGRSVIFVSRYIDSNNLEVPDPIEYVDTKIIYEGNSGQFADKPWIGIGYPDYGNETVPIPVPSTGPQYIPRFDVYMVYSVFTGDLDKNVVNKIMFSRSTDCGNTWQNPIKLSESHHINQGTTLAIDPNDGTIYVAWRQFGSSSAMDAILMCKSVDGGQKFTKASTITTITPFDQPTIGRDPAMPTVGPVAFRTNSYPTLAVDDNGYVYLAWAERKSPGGFARIVLTISTDKGDSWSLPPDPIDDAAEGHQFMPSLNYASGKLLAAWYDSRNDYAAGQCSHGSYIIDDFSTCNWRHTIDVWAAQAEILQPGSSSLSLNSPLNLIWKRTRVSRYLFHLQEDPNNPGMYLIYQAQFNPPNYLLFKGGTVAFIGDYIDTATAQESDGSVSHVVWTDNRDVRPPLDDNWTVYNPPDSVQNQAFKGLNSAFCTNPDHTGMRNQNIYTARITAGIIAGSPGNTKPLGGVQRAFVIFIKNTTNIDREFLLQIIEPQGANVNASFLCDEDLDSLQLEIGANSSISRSVFVGDDASDPDASIIVDITEVNAPSGDTPIHSFIVLNPDPSSPDINLPTETHNPDIENPDIENWVVSTNVLNPDIANPDIANPDIANPNIFNPDIANPDIANPNIFNLSILNPDIANPDIANPNIFNPDIANSAFGDLSNAQIIYKEWRVTNTGNTASSYTFKTIAPDLPEGLYAQLLIYKVYYTPGAQGCTLAASGIPHHELLVNIQDASGNFVNPDIANPDIQNPDIANPDIANATFYLGPGEEALVTLVVIDPGEQGLTAGISSGGGILDNGPVDPSSFLNYAGAVVVAHATNTGGTEPPIATLPLEIGTASLPDGQKNGPYSAALIATGGLPPYNWELVSGVLPADITLSPNGFISGQNVQTAGTFPLTVRVTDSSNPGQFLTRSYTLFIAPLTFAIVTGSPLPDGRVGLSYSETLGAINGEGALNWTLLSGDLPPGLSLSAFGVISGTPQYDPEISYPKSYSFVVQVTDSFEVPRIVSREFTIEILPVTSAWMPMYSGPGDDEGTDVTVDSEGNLIVTGFSSNGTDQDIITIKYDPEGNLAWASKYPDGVARYDGQYGDDKATAVAVDASGNIYITGFSTGEATGADCLTIKYDRDGNLAWESRYNGRNNGIDMASAIVVGASGVYVTGSSEGKTSGPDFVTLKLDAGNGNILWEARYDGPSHLGDFPTALVTHISSPENVYVTGYTYRGKQVKHADFCTVKYDALGNEVWVALFDSRRNGNDESHAIAVDEQGNVYITGKSQESQEDDPLASHDYLTIKYDNSGQMIWMAREEGPSTDNDEALAVAVDPSGNVYITGRSEGTGTSTDYFTLKYDSTGQVVWQNRYDGPAHGRDEPSALAIDSTGIYVTGFSTGLTAGTDFCTIKYDSAGNVLWEARFDGGNGDDKATAIVLDPLSGAVYATGFTTGQSGKTDLLILKYLQ